MAQTLSVSEARASLPDLLDRVAAGEEITVTRHGRPVAVVVRPDALRARRADEALAAGDRVRHLLDQARTARLPAGPLAPDEADARAAELRAERARR